MKMSEILEVIKSLACSQGFYGRLYRSIMELKENDEESYADLVGTLESQNFSDNLDIVMFLEG